MLEKDGSWGAEMGVIRGLGTSALMWALLSESQDVLLTQTINQASSTNLVCQRFAEVEVAPNQGDKPCWLTFYRISAV